MPREMEVCVDCNRKPQWDSAISFPRRQRDSGHSWKMLFTLKYHFQLELIPVMKSRDVYYKLNLIAGNPWNSDSHILNIFISCASRWQQNLQRATKLPVIESNWTSRTRRIWQCKADAFIFAWLRGDDGSWEHQSHRGCLSDAWRSQWVNCCGW